MVSYLEFSIRNEEMMNAVLLETDTLLQYGEDLDNEDKLPEEDFETVDKWAYRIVCEQNKLYLFLGNRLCILFSSWKILI